MECIETPELGPCYASVAACLHLTDGCSPAPASNNISVHILSAWLRRPSSDWKFPSCRWAGDILLLRHEYGEVWFVHDSAIAWQTCLAIFSAFLTAAQPASDLHSSHSFSCADPCLHHYTLIWPSCLFCSYLACLSPGIAIPTVDPFSPLRYGLPRLRILSRSAH